MFTCLHFLGLVVHVHDAYLFFVLSTIVTIHGRMPSLALTSMKDSLVYLLNGLSFVVSCPLCCNMFRFSPEVYFPSSL